MKIALKWISRVLIGLLAICGAVALVIGFGFDGAKDYSLGRMERMVNQDYDDIDRIELFLISAPSGAKPDGTFPAGGEEKDYPVYGTATLTGSDAQKAAELWSYTLKDARMGSMCHGPPYGIRMYAGKKLRFESTICWGCHNFSVHAFPNINTYWGFDAESKGAQDLLALFDKALPYPKPPAKKE